MHDVYVAASLDPASAPPVEVTIWRESSGCGGLYGAAPAKLFTLPAGSFATLEFLGFSVDAMDTNNNVHVCDSGNNDTGPVGVVPTSFPVTLSHPCNAQNFANATLSLVPGGLAMDANLKATGFALVQGQYPGHYGMTKANFSLKLHLARGGTLTATCSPFWTAVGPPGGYNPSSFLYPVVPPPGSITPVSYGWPPLGPQAAPAPNSWTLAGAGVVELIVEVVAWNGAASGRAVTVTFAPAR